jgi:hypothetical protein
VQTAPFLSLAQKRKIFHDNAVRFFGPLVTAPPSATDRAN